MRDMYGRLTLGPPKLLKTQTHMANYRERQFDGWNGDFGRCKSYPLSSYRKFRGDNEVGHGSKAYDFHCL